MANETHAIMLTKVLLQCYGTLVNFLTFWT